MSVTKTHTPLDVYGLRQAQARGCQLADYEYTNTRANSVDAPEGGMYTLTFDGQERQVLLMALGELLGSVRRSEHLTPTIQALIARVESAPPTADRRAPAPEPQNRTDAED